MKIKVLVIGNGYIGKNLCEYLGGYVDSVLDVSQIYSLKYTTPDIDQRLVDELSNGGYKYVVNCVGYTGFPNVDGCESNREITKILNVDWPRRLAEYCNSVNVDLINISSGCVYNGYEKEYTEQDAPNFGVGNPEASWYSTTKHMCEMELNKLGVYNFRIRMPISGDISSSKNYLTKILKYNDLIDLVNSKTVIEDLFDFLYKFMVKADWFSIPKGNFNVVNPNPLTTKKVVDILDEFGLWNPYHKYISVDELNGMTACKRSNCVLSVKYLEETTGLSLPPEEESIRRVLTEGFKNG